MWTYSKIEELDEFKETVMGENVARTRQIERKVVVKQLDESLKLLMMNNSW